MLFAAILAAAIVGVAHGRSRPGGAARGGDAGLEISRAADAYRPAVDSPPHRQVRHRGHGHRRSASPATGRSSRPSGSRSRWTGRRRCSGSPEFLITSVELTDWEMLVEKWETGHNIPQVHAGQPAAAGPEALHDHGQVRARLARPVYLRRSPVAVEHRLPQSGLHARATSRTTTAPAVFNGGTVQIQNYKPMWANMRARFMLDGPHVDVDRIEIDTDGAKTVARGSVELGKRWPEQTFDFQSRVEFPRMGDIFFSDQNWDLTGEGDFDGQVPSVQGRPRRQRPVQERRARLEGLPVPRAGRRRCSGRRRRSTSGTPARNSSAAMRSSPIRSSRSARRTSAPRRGSRPATRTPTSPRSPIFRNGAASGWRARCRDKTSSNGRPAGSSSGATKGSLTVVPPPGIETMTPRAAAVARLPERAAASGGRSRRCRFPRTCRSPPSWPTGSPPTTSSSIQAISPPIRRTCTFKGGTSWGERLALCVPRDEPRLAGKRSGAGGPDQGFRIAERRGRGDRRARRIRRRDDRSVPARARRRRCSAARICAPGTPPGAPPAATSCTTTTTSPSPTASSATGDSEIRTDGKFSLAAPREDGGDEIDARFRVTRRDLDSLRHAFQIDEYPLSGRMSGEFDLKGERARPIGVGTMTDRRRRGVRRADPERDGVAAIRRHRRAARRHPDGERRRRDHRRRVHRLGFDLLVQRRRPADSGRAASRSCPIPADRCPASSSCRRAATARSMCRATTSNSASAISLSSISRSGR